MVNYWALTDELGAVNFDQFYLERGPEGLYTFKIISRNF
jgi:hypothetical protein